jgi:ABC-type glycerol-3-phosphate transport system substrate-binding protein
MRRLPTVTLMVLSLTMLNMCAQVAPPPVMRTVITFAAPREEKIIYDPIIRSFNSVNLNIEVRFRELEDILAGNNTAPSISGNALDTVVRMADTAIVPFIGNDNVTKNSLYDLSSFVSADTEFQPSDYYTGTLEIWSQSGVVYGIPRDISIPLLSYNKDLWSRYDLPMPSNHWTWYDLVRSAQQLAQSSNLNSKTTMYGLTDGADGQLLLVGSLYETNPAYLTTSPDYITLNTPEVVTVFDWMSTLAQTKALYTPTTSQSSEDAGDLSALIQDQRLGIWREEMLPADSSTDNSFTIGHFLMPPLPRPLSNAGTNAYIISRGTQHAEEAWQWLSFVSKQALIIPTSASLLPARRSLIEQSRYWKELDSAVRTTILTMFDRPVQTIDSPPIYQEVLNVLAIALQATLTGKRSDDALLEVQELLDTARTNRASAPSSVENQPFVVATPQPEIALEGRQLITFGSFADDTERIRLITKVFQQDHSDMFVQLKDSSNVSQLSTFASLAETMDCFTWPGDPPTSDLTATLDLQPILDADATIPRDEYPSALLSSFRRGVALHGLPYVVSLKTLGYNARLFSEAGIQPPSVEWTLDDLIAAAEVLTQQLGDIKQYGYAETPVQIPNLTFFLNRFGASIMHFDGETNTPNFTDPKVVQAVEYYIKLLRTTSPRPRFQGYNGEPQTENGKVFPDLLKQGRIGMWFNLGAFSLLDQAQSLDVAVAPLPLGGGTIGSDIVEIESSFYISARNTQPQACWEWFKALSGSVGVLPQLGVEGQHYYPARRSVAESVAFKSQTASGALGVYKIYMKALVQAPITPRLQNEDGDLSALWFYRAVDRALQGKDVARELALAQQIAEQYRACIHTGADNSICLQQADPTFGR